MPFQLLLALAGIPVLLNSCIGKTTGSAEYQKLTEVPIVSYAKRYKIDLFEGYSQLLIINPWQGAKDIIQCWYLVPVGKEIPASIDSNNVIRIPVRKIVCMSTTHLSMISALDEMTSVCGFSGTKFIYNEDLRRNVDEGKISEIGYEDNLNKELILKMKPDLVMVYGIGGESAGYIGKLKELGIRVLYNADYLETDALAKAEWIKMIGAIYAKEEMADSIFRTIELEYNRLKLYIKENAARRPKVMLGLPFRDTWYISPGNSYISQLISDAGGEYLWESTESVISMPTGLENVYMKALKAEYWLNTGSAGTREEIKSIDPRLAELPCFINGNLFNNNKRTSILGGNDYWEGGAVNPHIILSDLGAILHPGLFKGRELFYYKKLN